MARKLVVCCDGTWNRERADTNVHRAYRHLAIAAGVPVDATRRLADGAGADADCRICQGRTAAGEEVHLLYQRGVGTSFGQLLSGGAAGVGLSGNVRSAYHFLAHRFEPGSELYLLGFSRGAYTARSLAGLVGRSGLLERPSEQQVLRLYLDEYVTEGGVQDRPEGMTAGAALAWIRERLGELLGIGLAGLQRHREVPIRFLGVLDTVGALGIPVPKAARLNEPLVGFHDTRLGPRVEHAVQALAVDERRGPYRPTLWTAPAGEAAMPPGRSCLQVWFPGVHSDIGGGYPERGVGDLTLDFLMRRAVEAGLLVDPARPLPPVDLADPLPPQHESFEAFWRKASAIIADGGEPRAIPTGPFAGPDGAPLEVLGRQMLHPALVDRLGQRVRVLEEGAAARSIDYRPPGVPWSADEIDCGRAPLARFRERAGLRLPATEPAELDGRPCTIRDVSPCGWRVEMDAPPARGARVRLAGRGAEVVWAAGRQAGLRLVA